MNGQLLPAEELVKVACVTKGPNLVWSGLVCMILKLSSSHAPGRVLLSFLSEPVGE